jgi:hypothetical protein
MDIKGVLENMLGVFDSPIARRKISGEIAEEARASASEAVSHFKSAWVFEDSASIQRYAHSANDAAQIGASGGELQSVYAPPGMWYSSGMSKISGPLGTPEVFYCPRSGNYKAVLAAHDWSWEGGFNECFFMAYPKI